MSRSVWAAIVARLGDNLGHLCEVDHKPDQCAVAGKPDKPGEPCVTCVGHYCPRHAERHCNCADDGCADDDIGDADRIASSNKDRVRTPEPNQYGNFRCPISGLACDKFVCKEWCEGSGTGSAIRDDRGNA